MRNKITKGFAGLAALAALALGGAALASAGQGGSQPATPAAPAAAVQQQGSVTPDAETNDAATAEKPGVETNDGTTAADTDSIQDENGKDDANEPAGADRNEGPEKAESGSEVAGDDGPGGHADEPGNPNADHQFEGNE